MCDRDPSTLLSSTFLFAYPALAALAALACRPVVEGGSFTLRPLGLCPAVPSTWACLSRHPLDAQTSPSP